MAVAAWVRQRQGLPPPATGAAREVAALVTAGVDWAVEWEGMLGEIGDGDWGSHLGGWTCTGVFLGERLGLILLVDDGRCFGGVVFAL